MGIFDVFKKKAKIPQQIDRPNETVNIVNQVSASGRTNATQVDIDFDTINSIKSTFVAFDVETTGLSASIDRIVEVGAVFFVNGVPAHRYQTLINPGVKISAAATNVNHITNEMLEKALQETVVYPQLIDFLGEAINGNIIMCAHNASFDFEFLCKTLSRLGYNANITYVDTLSLSRKYVRSLENHRLATVGNHFGFTNIEAHRAGSDAELCGKILCGVLDLISENIEKEKKRIQNSVPTQEELEVCAFIQNSLSLKGVDVEKLRFRKNSSNYVEATCLYPFLKFKLTRKRKYIIVSKNAAIENPLPMESCTEGEGGATYVRVYFNNPYDLMPFSDYFLIKYNHYHKSMLDYSSQNSYTRKEAERIIKTMRYITREEEEIILSSVRNQKYEDIPPIEFNKRIDKEDVKIVAMNNRCPLSEVININDWEKGYDVGSPYYYEGERARKEGKIDEAIVLFDKARYYGYEAPALYESYAKAFRQIKDYSNEILIIDEFLSRNTYGKEGVFSARRDKVIKLLFTQQESEHKVQKTAPE